MVNLGDELARMIQESRKPEDSKRLEEFKKWQELRRKEAVEELLVKGGSWDELLEQLGDGEPVNLLE
jgi:hypothetical protein